MSDLQEGFFEDSPWLRPMEFRNLISTRIIPLAVSEQLTGRLINIRRISLRAFVREWNTEPGTKSRARRSREIGEPCRRHVSQTNIPCSLLRFFDIYQANVARASLRCGDFANNVEFSDDSFRYLRKIILIISRLYNWF